MQIPANPARQFIWPVRVYYEDTDAGGVVYHSTYLNYCERARTEWLRAIGIEQRNMRAGSGLVFVVRRVTADYFLGAELDDALEVHTAIDRIGAASIHFAQRIMRGAEQVFTAQVTIACVDWNVRRAARIPDDIKSLIERAQ